VLAESRRAADAASTCWKDEIYRHIQSRIEKGSKMTALRMCDLGHVSRVGLYRYDAKAATELEMPRPGRLGAMAHLSALWI
jgi:hypothetical protein